MVPGSINCVSASRDASVLIIASESVVSLFRAFSNELLAHFVVDFDVLSAEFTPDSRWIMIIGKSEILLRQVSGGCASHSHKFEGPSMAIAAASGRMAVVDFAVDDDGKYSSQIYASGDSGYSTLTRAKGNLRTILSR